MFVDVIQATEEMELIVTTTMNVVIVTMTVTEMLSVQIRKEASTVPVMKASQDRVTEVQAAAILMNALTTRICVMQMHSVMIPGVVTVVRAKTGIQEMVHIVIILMNVLLFINVMEMPPVRILRVLIVAHVIRDIREMDILVLKLMNALVVSINVMAMLPVQIPWAHTTAHAM